MSSWASPSTCMSKAVLTEPLEHSTCPFQRSLLSFRMKSRSSIPSCASSSLDLVVTISCGLILQVSLIIALSFHCRCWRFGFVNGQVSLTWSIRSAHKSCTHGHMSWKRGGGKRELVAAPWTSSWRFSHVLWLKVHSRWCLRACLLGSKRKLPPSAFRSNGLPSVVCHPRGMQFLGTMYICNHGPLSSTWAHCISCAFSASSHSRRCCCCPFQCGRRCMETHLNSAWGPGQYTADHDLHLSCITLSPFSSIASLGWSGGAKVLCILHHRGVQLILAYNWARPAILVVGKGRGGMFLFLLFLHFLSCSSFFPVPLFHLLYSLFYLFSPFLWETTQNDSQGLTCR